MMRLVLGLALAPIATAAAAFDVSTLMKLLAQTPEVRASFVEQKHSPLLVAPLDSSGTLLYRRPDVVEKNVVKPRPERLRILRDEVVVERGGKERRIALDSQPAMAGFAASLRGVLAGDAEALRKHFKLAVTGDEKAWTLELTPADGTIGAHVERVVVGGRAGRVERIETFETTGDRTVLEIR